METGRNITKTSGALSTRSMLSSLVIHVVVMALLMLVPIAALRPTPPPTKEVDIVFYRPPEVEVRVRPAMRPVPRSVNGGAPPGAPAPARNPIPNAPPGPDGPGNPDLPSGPQEGYRVEPTPPP